MIARPRGTESAVTICTAPASRLGPWLRARSGSTRSLSNHATSSGWHTSTGARVVGRSTPGSLTRRPTRELTIVDLPAPVEPPTTASSGASICRSRGST